MCDPGPEHNTGCGTHRASAAQVTVKDRIPLSSFTLQVEEVQAVDYIDHKKLLAKYQAKDDQFCVADLEAGVRVCTATQVLQMCFHPIWYRQIG